MARQGAQAVGVEIREANVAKARFVKEALNLECSGILYHLTADLPGFGTLSVRSQCVDGGED